MQKMLPKPSPSMIFLTLTIVYQKIRIKIKTKTKINLRCFPCVGFALYVCLVFIIISVNAPLKVSRRLSAKDSKPD